MSIGERMPAESFSGEKVVVTFAPDGRVAELVTTPEHLPRVFAAIRPIEHGAHDNNEKQWPVLPVSRRVEQKETATDFGDAEENYASGYYDNPNASTTEEDTAEPTNLELADAYEELRALERMKQQLEGDEAEAAYDDEEPEFDDSDSTETQVGAIDPVGQMAADSGDIAEDDTRVDLSVVDDGKRSIQDKIRDRRKDKWRKTRRRLAYGAITSVTVYALAPGPISKGVEYTCDNGPQAICVTGHALVGGVKATNSAVAAVVEKVMG